MPSSIPKLALLFFGATGISLAFYVQSEKLQKKQDDIQNKKDSIAMLRNFALQARLDYLDTLIHILRDSGQAARSKPAPTPHITVNVPPFAPTVVYVNPPRPSQSVDGAIYRSKTATKYPSDSSIRLAIAAANQFIASENAFVRDSLLRVRTAISGVLFSSAFAVNNRMTDSAYDRLQGFRQMLDTEANHINTNINVYLKSNVTRSPNEWLTGQVDLLISELSPKRQRRPRMQIIQAQLRYLFETAGQNNWFALLDDGTQ
jgi:hypothetical protein